MPKIAERKWKEVEPTEEAFRQILVGAVVSMEPVIFQDGEMGQVLLGFADGREVLIESVPLHGDESRLQVSIPD